MQLAQFLVCSTLLWSVGGGYVQDVGALEVGAPGNSASKAFDGRSRDWLEMFAEDYWRAKADRGVDLWRVKVGARPAFDMPEIDAELSWDARVTVSDERWSGEKFDYHRLMLDVAGYGAALTRSLFGSSEFSRVLEVGEGLSASLYPVNPLDLGLAFEQEPWPSRLAQADSVELTTEVTLLLHQDCDTVWFQPRGWAAQGRWVRMSVQQAQPRLVLREERFVEKSRLQLELGSVRVAQDDLEHYQGMELVPERTYEVLELRDWEGVAGHPMPSAGRRCLWGAVAVEESMRVTHYTASTRHLDYSALLNFEDGLQVVDGTRGQVGYIAGTGHRYPLREEDYAFTLQRFGLSWEARSSALRAAAGDYAAACGPLAILLTSHLAGLEVSLADVCAAHSGLERHRSNSLHELQLAFEALGLRSDAVRLSAADLRGIECVAVLHTRPLEQWDASVGASQYSHFAVVRADHRTGGFIVASPPARPIIMTAAQLDEIASGAALLLGRAREASTGGTGNTRAWNVGGLVVLLLMLFGAAWTRRRRGLHAVAQLVVGVPLLLIVAGCGELAGKEVGVSPSAVSSQGRLVVEGQSQVDFGLIDASRGIVSHVFHVRNDGEVELHLDEAVPTCTCTEIPDIGGVLMPGESLAVPVTLSVAGRKGALQGSVSVIARSDEVGVQRAVLALHAVVDTTYELVVSPLIISMQAPSQERELRFELRGLAPGSPEIDAVKVVGDGEAELEERYGARLLIQEAPGEQWSFSGLLVIPSGGARGRGGEMLLGCDVALSTGVTEQVLLLLLP